MNSIVRHAGLLGLMAAVFVSAMVLMPRVAAADEDRDALKPLCLNVIDGGTVVFPLRVLNRRMVEPEPNEILLVKGLVNGTEPALGAATRLTADTVVVNLSSSLAGFFIALQIQWNPRSNSGTGRVVGELTNHQNVIVLAYPCR